MHHETRVMSLFQGKSISFRQGQRAPICFISQFQVELSHSFPSDNVSKLQRILEETGPYTERPFFLKPSTSLKSSKNVLLNELTENCLNHRNLHGKMRKNGHGLNKILRHIPSS